MVKFRAFRKNVRRTPAKPTDEMRFYGRRETKNRLSIREIHARPFYAALNNREQTLDWLETAVDESERMISQIKFVEKYDFVRPTTVSPHLAKN